MLARPNMTDPGHSTRLSNAGYVLTSRPAPGTRLLYSMYIDMFATFKSAVKLPVYAKKDMYVQ